MRAPLGKDNSSEDCAWYSCTAVTTRPSGPAAEGEKVPLMLEGRHIQLGDLIQWTLAICALLSSVNIIAYYFYHPIIISYYLLFSFFLYTHVFVYTWILDFKSKFHDQLGENRVDFIGNLKNYDETRSTYTFGGKRKV